MKKQIRLLFGFLLLSVLATQSSCNIFQHYTESNFDRNRRLWRESKITNYRMTVDLQKTGHAAPMGKFIITVRGGVAESIKSANDPEYVLRKDRFEKYDTIDKIFDIIEREEKEKWYSDIKEMEYDSKLGYPKKLRLDNFSAMDDELFFQVLQFEVLE
ncbi:MAG: DUF6174 domain-containing protein [Pyrinomonadaceae bacterium]